MAVKLAAVTGNMTTAGTWQDIDVTFRDVADTTVQSIDQTFRGATPFTPGAIQIDGILIKMGQRQNAASGTMSVRLYNSTDAAAVVGTTVTIDSADVPLPGSPAQNSMNWSYFKFAAPVTLTAGKAYYPQMATANINQGINVCRVGGVNYAWACGLVLTGASAAAPTTNDQVIIVGAWTAAATISTVTVTMDQTNSAIKYGTTSTSLQSVVVGRGGVLTFGTAAATNYYMNIQGLFAVAKDGVLNVGTVATPIPRGSTATLNFDITGSTGNYYLQSHGTITFQGLSRTVGKNVVGCLLTANHTAGATTFAVDRDTGWLSGDSVIVAGTQRTSNKADDLTLAIDAGAALLTTGASSFDHAGLVASGIQAEVILATRNVVCRVTTAGKNSFIHLQKQMSFDADWAAFIGMSATLSSTYRGISYTDPVAFGVDYCHFDGFNDSLSHGFTLHSGSSGVPPSFDQVYTNLTYTRMQDYLYYESNPATLSSGYATTLQDVWGVAKAVYYSAGLAYWGSPKPLSLIRCRVSGSQGAVPVVTLGNTDAAVGNARVLFQDCVFHDMGIAIQITGTHVDNIVLDNVFFYRLKTTGSLTAAIYFLTASNGLLVKNSQFLSPQHYAIYHTVNRKTQGTFRNCKFGAEAAYSTGSSFLFSSAGGQQGDIGFRFENCLFGDAAGGVYTDPTADFDANNGCYHYYRLVFVNSNSGNATKMSALMIQSFQNRAYAAYQREQGVLGTHRVYYPRLGTVARDASVYRSSPASEKMTPTTGTTDFKLESQGKRFDCSVGSQRSPSVWVKTDVAYNGAAPRLMMRANPALGTDDDVVLATHSLVSGSWVQLTGTMATPAEDDGQMEVYVDCDGSAGNVWVDDWSV